MGHAFVKNRVERFGEIWKYYIRKQALLSHYNKLVTGKQVK